MPKGKIRIVTPQFERVSKLRLKYKPENSKEFEKFCKEDTIELLTDVGFRLWNDEDPEGKLYLFPAEWYDIIPKGFEVIDISMYKEKFVPGKTDNDRRFGCLPYGILR